MNCSFTIDGKPFNVEVEGDFFQGENQVLFSEKNNVLEHCSWLKEGFTKIKIADENDFLELKENVHSILSEILVENKIPIDNKFTLENYHHYVHTDAQHQLVIEKTRFLAFKDFKIDMDEIMEKFSESVGKKLKRNTLEFPQEIVIMRINRPSSMDINPFHRDGYLKLWENVLNVWIPLAGCNQESSLPVIPGSHYWNESEIIRTKAKGASINGLSYHVPAIVSYTKGLHAVCPNPEYGEALIFTPFLIHGAALNRQMDTTRISLELRLFYTQ